LFATSGVSLFLCSVMEVSNLQSVYDIIEQMVGYLSGMVFVCLKNVGFFGFFSVVDRFLAHSLGLCVRCLVARGIFHEKDVVQCSSTGGAACCYCRRSEIT
ncbi:hypothetical protein, partial [Candidatus Ichthyocystis hellenicum]|uniref:hypothetical protein n=1 Tax=Candidatus Ichthyocystis hellenicum TaxID=1561003 RepID=UPI001F5ED7EC